jgi:aldehyde dehydrogenase (NAD+)
MIKPTLIYPAAESDEIMQSEIFGPVLPVMVYDDMDEVIEFVSRRPRPLALYLFAEDKDVINRIMNSVPFGGGCVNDTIVHLASDTLPFGGIGNSGMGRYHGKASFDCFTCDKSVLNKSTKMDLPMRYPPYTEKSLNLVKKFLK